MIEKFYFKNFMRGAAILARHVILLTGFAGPCFAADNTPLLPGPEEEIESTVFDLYLSDTLQGSILVRYTEQWFEIDDGQDLVDQLKEVKEPQKLLPLFEGRILKSKSEAGIGTVAYDLKTFRIVLTLDPSLLPEKTINLLNRLPDPENNFSILQNAGIASTGDINDNQKASLNHRTVSSIGKYFAVLDATAVRDDDYIFTEGFVGGIVGDYQVSSGLLQTKGQLFANSVEIAGAKFETSEDVFLDRDRIRGSKLEIFVPSRSRVEFFREERLLSVQILDFGLQEVDTTQFPDGSYDIEIVINEDGGGVARERRFFTKSGYLAIRSRPIFFLEAGSLRNQVSLEDTPIYQTGFRWRASGISELKGSIYGNDELQIGELETIGVFRDFLFGAGASLSTENDSGVAANLSGRVLGVNFDFNISETLTGGLDVNPDEFVIDDQGRRRLSVNQRAKLVAPERSSISGGITKNFQDVSLRYAFNRNKRPINKLLNNPEDDDPGDDDLDSEVEERFTYGPRFEWRILSDQKKALRFDTSYLNTEEGSKVLFGLSLRYNFDSKFSYNSDLNGRKEDSGDESTFRNTFGYDDRQRNGRGSRLVYTNDLRSRDGENSDRFLTNQIIGEHTNSYIRSNGFIRDIKQSKDDGTATGINAETSFVYSQGAGISVSHPPKEGAVLIADIESLTSTENFELLVDGQTYAVIEGGRRSVVGLQPFRTYKISIRPVQGKELVDFDNKIYEVTLFPGNVVRKTWSVEKIVIVTGTLVDNVGSPISSRRIKGTREYVVTERDGTFQAELLGGEKLYIDSKGLKCEVEYKLPASETPLYVVDLGQVTCR